MPVNLRLTELTFARSFDPIIGMLGYPRNIFYRVARIRNTRITHALREPLTIAELSQSHGS